MSIPTCVLPSTDGVVMSALPLRYTVDVDGLAVTSMESLLIDASATLDPEAFFITASVLSIVKLDGVESESVVSPVVLTFSNE
jgi:hypothetical protein